MIKKNKQSFWWFDLEVSSEEKNILPNEDDSYSSSYEEYSDEYYDDDNIILRDGMKWRKTSSFAQQITVTRNTRQMGNELTFISKNIDTQIRVFQLLLMIISFNPD